MAIHCLLEETLLLRYLLGLLLQGALHYRRAGRELSTCCPIGQLAAGPQGPLLFMPSNKRHSSSPHQPPPALASSIHSILFVARTAMETRPSLLCTCGDSSTGPQGPQNDIGSDTARTYGRRTIPNPSCPGHTQEPGPACWSRIPLTSCLATGPGLLEDLRHHMRSPLLQLLLLSMLYAYLHGFSCTGRILDLQFADCLPALPMLPNCGCSGSIRSGIPW